MTTPDGTSATIGPIGIIPYIGSSRAFVKCVASPLPIKPSRLNQTSVDFNGQSLKAPGFNTEQSTGGGAPGKCITSIR